MPRSLWILIAATLTLAGCAHQASVPIPTDPTNQMEWEHYYEDQFKAYGGEVGRPEDSAPAAQRLAYEEARSSWQRKQILGWVGASLALAIGVGSLVATLGQL